jgi:signal transduction histidine kinase/ActR/RegA family two-component response regulator/HAMP domain-containing protein
VPRFQDISIKRKLTAIIMIASTVAALLVSGAFVAYELFTFRQTMVTDISTWGEVTGNLNDATLSFYRPDEAKRILQKLGKKKHYTGVALYDSTGKLFAEYVSPNNPGESFPNKPEAEGATFRGDRLWFFKKIYDATSGEFEGTVCLKSDLTELDERFTRYAGIIVLFTFASLLVTLFLSARLQRIISRPIFHLAETAMAVSANKKYSMRATKHGNDEMGQLIDRFNEMLGQIQKRDSELQQAHDKLELRVEERTRDLREEIGVRERAESALKQQLVRISLLNQITQAISDRQDTDSILHVVLRQLEDHMGLDLGLIALVDAKMPTLNVAALRVKNSLLAEQFDFHEGSVVPLADSGFQLCEQGQTVYFPDTIKGTAPFVEKLAGTGWRSAVAVPLMVEEKLFGVLLTARLKTEGFTSGDCEFLRMLSEHVALAAHQSCLHRELETAYNDLRRTQATVLQQERLTALGQMASGIAHDVNNALSPVVGFSDIIMNGDFGLDNRGKKYLKYIRTAGEDIAHIVARLREFYRTREHNESLQPVNVNVLAEQVVEMTRPRWRDIPQSNGLTIEMETDLAADMPDMAGIESEIREALTNLVLNAVDAMPKGGKITLRTRAIQPENGGGKPTHIAVDVSDSGTGMDEETRKRCLEPFFSTKGKRGTGLGLAMVYGVIKRHEGTIDIKTEPGKGTTFHLSFPVRANLCKETELEKRSPIEPLQILCIDDEPLLRELIKEILERDGHTVEVSDGGHTGLDQFRLASERGRPFDVVITDLGMPYMDGRQVVKAVKQESPSTPVIMLTGWGALMKEDGNTPEQVDGILSKPPRSRELRETLSRFKPAKKFVKRGLNGTEFLTKR